MTVTDLIDKLSRFDGTHKVMIWDPESCDYEDITGLLDNDKTKVLVLSSDSIE